MCTGFNYLINFHTNGWTRWNTWFYFKCFDDNTSHKVCAWHIQISFTFHFIYTFFFYTRSGTPHDMLLAIRRNSWTALVQRCAFSVNHLLTAASESHKTGATTLLLMSLLLLKMAANVLMQKLIHFLRNIISCQPRNFYLPKKIKQKEIFWWKFLMIWLLKNFSRQP